MSLVCGSLVHYGIISTMRPIAVTPDELSEQIVEVVSRGIEGHVKEVRAPRAPPKRNGDNQ